MNNTLKTLSKIITPEYENLSLEQLAEAYTTELNPSVLASAFRKTFKLSVKISQKFFGLTESDIASFALETLDKCLQIYKTGETSFATFYTTVFNNRLRQETESLNTQKRKVCLYSDSLDQLAENGFDVSSNMEPNSFCVKDLKYYGLDKREMVYCKLLLDGYTNKEISEKLNTSIMTLSNIRKKLRVKLSPMLLCF